MINIKEHAVAADAAYDDDVLGCCCWYFFFSSQADKMLTDPYTRNTLKQIVQFFTFKALKLVKGIVCQFSLDYIYTYILIVCSTCFVKTLYDCISVCVFIVLYAFDSFFHAAPTKYHHT